MSRRKIRVNTGFSQYPGCRRTSANIELAEGVGFEPTRERKPPGGFQDRCLKPLGHPSKLLNHLDFRFAKVGKNAICYRFATISFSALLFRAACIASSTRAAASSCMPGSTCVYRSSVMPTLLWPRRSLATFGWTPAASMCVAWAVPQIVEPYPLSPRCRQERREGVRQAVRLQRAAIRLRNDVVYRRDAARRASAAPAPDRAGGAAVPRQQGRQGDVRPRPDLVSFSRHARLGLLGARDYRELPGVEIDGAPPQGGDLAPA